MNRIYLLIFSFFVFIIFQIPFVKDNIISFANTVKKEFFLSLDTIYEKIKYFKTKDEEIKALKTENRLLQDKLATYEYVNQICKDLKIFKKIDKPNLVFTQTISYAALPDFTKIYVDYNKPISTPRGLVYNNFAAGILVKNVGNYSLGLLNTNKNTSYTVIIGDKEVRGIFKGGINTVKYIQKFAPIKVGDIVKTSGLDGIFYKGAIVGKVIKVEQKKLYQEAKVKLFYNKLTPDFFYVVEKNVTIRKTFKE